ncbi:MAG TPA: STAS domain-containing protein [Gemmatimonadaceae bacterium]|nr:STAS domain-containing protein [Gemmatimonadaceae bacterium]
MLPTTYANNESAAAALAMPNAGIPHDAFAAPSRIKAENRGDFRKAALAYVERQALEGAPVARLDLAQTEELDAAGLGILVLLQKRANELRLPLELVRVPRDLRHLLSLTKLDHLFKFA